MKYDYFVLKGTYEGKTGNYETELRVLFEDGDNIQTELTNVVTIQDNLETDMDNILELK